MSEDAYGGSAPGVLDPPVRGLVGLWLGLPVNGENEEATELLGDTVNSLFSAGLRLASVRSLLQDMPDGGAPRPLLDEADERVHLALEEIDDAIQGLRRIVLELR